jgi:DivIVA domain-containing protein
VRAEGSNLRVALRGYDRAQVEAFVAKVQRDLGGSGSVSTAPPPLWPSVGPPQFSVVLRGYDPAAVDDFLRRHADPSARAAALREVSFPVRLRGYDRGQVDAYVSGLAG